MKSNIFTLFLLAISIGTVQAQNVGIGTATPTVKLEIKGDNGTDLLNVKDDAGNARLYVEETGMVGIGNASPAYTLDVAGDINLTNALRISGNAGSAGQVLKSSGSGVSWSSETDPVWSSDKSNYYTKGNLQTNGQSNVHWGNLTNVPAGLNDGDDDNQNLSNVLSQGNSAGGNDLNMSNNTIHNVNSINGYSGSDVLFYDRPQSRDGLYVQSGTAYFNGEIRTDIIQDRGSGNTIRFDSHLNANGHNVDNVKSVLFQNQETTNVSNVESRLIWDNSEGLMFYHDGAWRRVMDDYLNDEDQTLGEVMNQGNVASKNLSMDIHDINMTNANSHITFENPSGKQMQLGDDVGTTSGIGVKAANNPNSGNPIFVVKSAGGAERLRVEHAGALKTSNRLEVDGTGNSYIKGNLKVGNPANSGGGTFAAKQVISSMWSDNNRYGYFEGRTKNNTRGFYIGYGDGGQEVDLRLDNASELSITGGSVGIGNASPNEKLDVKGKTQMRGGGGSSTTNANATQLLFSYSGGDKMKHAIRTRHHGGQDQQNAIDFFIWDYGTDAQTAEPSKRVMTIDGGGEGRVSLAGISPTYKLELPNVGTNGGGRGIANDWVTYSDRRIKSDMQELPYGLAEVLKMEPKYYFQHNSSYAQSGKIQVEDEGTQNFGIIAQELHKIIPEMVSKPENEDQELWSVSYDKLGPVLVKAIQEQEKKIQALQKENKRLKAIEAKYEKLEERMTEIEARLDQTTSSASAQR